MPTGELDAWLIALLTEYGTDGASVTMLSEITGRSKKTIKPNLTGLKRAGRVESTVAGIYARWYIAGKMRVAEKYQTIVDYVDMHPGCEGREIIREFGLAGASKQHYLRRLFESGDCRVRKADKYVDYRYWVGGGVRTTKERRYVPVVHEDDEKPFRHVVIPAHEAAPLKLRGVRSVFELANV